MLDNLLIFIHVTKKMNVLCCMKINEVLTDARRREAGDEEAKFTPTLAADSRSGILG